MVKNPKRGKPKPDRRTPRQTKKTKVRQAKSKPKMSHLSLYWEKGLAMNGVKSRGEDASIFRNKCAFMLVEAINVAIPNSIRTEKLQKAARNYYATVSYGVIHRAAVSRFNEQQAVEEACYKLLVALQRSLKVCSKEALVGFLYTLTKMRNDAIPNSVREVGSSLARVLQLTTQRMNPDTAALGRVTFLLREAKASLRCLMENIVGTKLNPAEDFTRYGRGFDQARCHSDAEDVREVMSHRRSSEHSSYNSDTDGVRRHEERRHEQRRRDSEGSTRNYEADSNRGAKRIRRDSGLHSRSFDARDTKSPKANVVRPKVIKFIDSSSDEEPEKTPASQNENEPGRSSAMNQRCETSARSSNSGSNAVKREEMETEVEIEVPNTTQLKQIKSEPAATNYPSPPKSSSNRSTGSSTVKMEPVFSPPKQTPPIVAPPPSNPLRTPRDTNSSLEEFTYDRTLGTTCVWRRSASAVAWEEREEMGMRRFADEIFVHFLNNVQREPTFKLKLKIQQLLRDKLQKELQEYKVVLRMCGSSPTRCASLNSNLNFTLIMENGNRIANTHFETLVRRITSFPEFTDLQLPCTVKRMIRADLDNTTMLTSFSCQEYTLCFAHFLDLCDRADERFSQLALLLKHWTVKQLSNVPCFAVVALLIHYLQCGVQPAILPNFRYLLPQKFNKEAMLEEINDSADINLPPAQNTQSLSSLLLGFFDYYSRFEYNVHDISLMRATLVRRASPDPEYVTNLLLMEPLHATHGAAKKLFRLIPMKSNFLMKVREVASTLPNTLSLSALRIA